MGDNPPGKGRDEIFIAVIVASLKAVISVMHPYRSLFFTVLELSFLRFSALPVLCAITLPLMPQCLYLLLSHYTVVLFFFLLRS